MFDIVRSLAKAAVGAVVEIPVSVVADAVTSWAASYLIKDAHTQPML